MRPIAPTTIRPNPMTKISTDAPLVAASWAKHFNTDFKLLSPAPKFGQLKLDVRV